MTSHGKLRVGVSQWNLKLKIMLRRIVFVVMTVCEVVAFSDKWESEGTFHLPHNSNWSFFTSSRFLFCPLICRRSAHAALLPTHGWSFRTHFSDKVKRWRVCENPLPGATKQAAEEMNTSVPSPTHLHAHTFTFYTHTSLPPLGSFSPGRASHW